MSTDILIGGTGFIGSVLGEALTAQGNTVVAIGHQPSTKPASHEELILDLATTPIPQRLFANTPRVYLLLGQTGPGFDASAELKLLTHILQAIAPHAGHVLFFSTTLAYGECATPADEATVLRPIGAYPAYKAAAESLVTTHIPAKRRTILRLGNVYGNPRNRGFINHVFRSHLSSPPTPLTLTNQGETRRDYLFLDDLVNAVCMISVNPGEHDTINVASGQSTSLNEVVAAIESVTGIVAPVQRSAEPPTNEPRSVLVDTSRFRTLTKMQPTNLQVGLQATYTRYQEEVSYAAH